jgi:hypothetical protein
VALWTGIGGSIALAVAAIALLLFFRRRASQSDDYSANSAGASEMTGTPSPGAIGFATQEFLNPASMIVTDLFVSGVVTGTDPWGATGLFPSASIVAE